MTTAVSSNPYAALNGTSAPAKTANEAGSAERFDDLAGRGRGRR